jgi:pimeloyl-ACP methyl ester carboxylesterase
MPLRGAVADVQAVDRFQPPPVEEAAEGFTVRRLAYRFVALGDIDQWVTITGRRCGNPIVLFLHGGPGNPLSPYADSLFSGWEDDFTLVQWDQRGAGRTFGRHPPGEGSTLTVQRMVDDGLALAEYLTRRLGLPKVVVVGGSWGSILVVHMIKARPALFHAYVGFAQVVGSAQNQAATYARLLVLARQADDVRTIDALGEVGPPPWTNPRHPGIVRRATREYEAKVTDAAPHVSAVRRTQGTACSPAWTCRHSGCALTSPCSSCKAPRTGHDPNTRMLTAIRTVLDERVHPLIE